MGWYQDYTDCDECEGKGYIHVDIDCIKDTVRNYCQGRDVYGTRKWNWTVRKAIRLWHSLYKSWRDNDETVTCEACDGQKEHEHHHWKAEI